MTRKNNDPNKLAGGYIWLFTYADLSDEESKAESENDEVPTAVVAVKESWLRDFIKEDFGDESDAVDCFLEEYTYDEIWLRWQLQVLRRP